MDRRATDRPISEEQFGELVERAGADPRRAGELIELLQESHPAYGQRGTAATVRMRGWALIALERHGLPDAALLYVLEELDTGRDPYLIAAAARALRSRPRRDPSFASYLVRAIDNVRRHDDLLSFASYGAHVDGDDGTTAMSELFATLRWLGSAAHGVSSDLELLLEEHRRGLPSSILEDMTSTIAAIRGCEPESQARDECCVLPWGLGRRIDDVEPASAVAAIAPLTFEDQAGRQLTFGELFVGRPSLVVFFYTRCDNPRKCSLSIAKLATVQRLISERGMTGQVRTAAITYDPGWDVPDRLRGYAQSRSVRLDDDNRMLRCEQHAMPAVRAHFGLGVNYVESLVNRHRVEAFVLDATGRVTVAFERLQWDEADVVHHLLAALDRTSTTNASRPSRGTVRRSVAAAIPSVLGSSPSLAVAFLPKCPICWAAYLSLFGIAGLERLAYAWWLIPALWAAMVVNVATLWLRGQSSGRMLPCYLGAAGAFAIGVLGMHWEVPWSRPIGVVLTLVASLLAAVGPGAVRRRALRPS